MAFLKKQSQLFFLFLAVFWSNLAVDLPKICEQEIEQARLVLENQAYKRKIIRNTAIIATLGAIGFGCYKAGQNLKQMVSKESLDDLAANLSLEERVHNLELKLNGNKGWGGFLSEMRSLVLMQSASILITVAWNKIFEDEYDILVLVKQLRIRHAFYRLERAQARFNPQVFINNAHCQKDQDLLEFAKVQLLASQKAVLSAAQLAEIKLMMRKIMILEATYLIKQMSFVVAYMRYFVSSENQSLINSFAEQLYHATYEFACQFELNLANQNDHEVFNQIGLFKASFELAISNFN